MQGSFILTKTDGVLIVRIAANARIRACGKASASLFAAPTELHHVLQYHQ